MVILLTAMIKLEKINKSYQQGTNSVHILHDIDLEIQEGELVAIVGESGSGKSTLINIIGFLDQEFSGNYYFQGQALHDFSRKQFSALRNRNVGFVFQNFKLIQGINVQENVALPLLYAGMRRAAVKERVSRVLTQVGLAGYEESFAQNMSGGQQQRISIARAIATNPHFLIADEPTGALDTETSQEIMNLFKELNANGTTIIMVTHDPKVAAQCQRTIRILDGRIVADSQEGTI